MSDEYAMSRTADPRIYAKAVKQSVSPSEYVINEIKFRDCIRPSDIPMSVDDPIIRVNDGDPRSKALSHECSWYVFPEYERKDT